MKYFARESNVARGAAALLNENGLALVVIAFRGRVHPDVRDRRVNHARFHIRRSIDRIKTLSVCVVPPLKHSKKCFVLISNKCLQVSSEMDCSLEIHIQMIAKK